MQLPKPFESCVEVEYSNKHVPEDSVVENKVYSMKVAAVIGCRGHAVLKT